MTVRLIALDIDGTLLDSSSHLSEANVRAVADATSRGIEVALVTGRRFDFARPIADHFAGPLTMIVNNGAVIKSKDGITHLRHLLPREIAVRVLHATRAYRNGAAVVFDRPLENQVIFESIDSTNARQTRYYERNRPYITIVSPLENCLDEDPIQVMYTGSVIGMRAVGVLLRAMPEANGQFALAVTEYASSDFSMIDVIHPACSKGAALAEWCALRGYAPSEVMAIGDNLNDREMLEFAGVPVIMENSVPELKSFGWRQTLSNDESGVAAAIAAYALGPS